MTMKTATFGIALLTALALAATAAAQAPDRYGVVLHAGDVMVPMRDGVRLATDVYRPARGGVPVETPFPVLLQRTPYGKEGRGLVERAAYFVRHGYVVVLQDTRGRYESEGTFSKYHDFDATDGFDTVEWIAALPYTAGDVGMFGTSYGAHTQADAAKMDPPHLGPLLLNQGGISDPWLHKVRNHGAFELGQQLGWAFDQLRLSPDPVVRAAFEAEQVADWFAAMPLRRGLSPLAAAPAFEDYVLDQLTRADHDRPDADVRHWTRLGVNWSAYYGRTADVPMLHVAGWYDPYVGSMFENYLGLTRARTSPIHLVVGPWTHGANTRSYAGDVEFGPDAAIPDFATGFHRQWFDRHLKQVPTGVDDWPPIRLFVMGTGDGRRDAAGRLHHGGYWRDAAAWPLPEAEPTRYYFHADGTLSPREPADAPPTTYTYDPGRPVPTIGGSFSGVLKRGAYDQREREFKAPRRRLGERLLRLAASVPAAQGAARRGRVPDGAARGPGRGRRPHPRHAVRVVDRRRHRLHGEARRRLSPERGLSDRVRAEPHRRHPPGALPERPEPARDDDAGGGLRTQHRAPSHREPLQGREPHPHRRLEQQLPALRRQPQHRGAARNAPAHGARGQHHPPRAGPPVPRGAPARGGGSGAGACAVERRGFLQDWVGRRAEAAARPWGCRLGRRLTDSAPPPSTRLRIAASRGRQDRARTPAGPLRP